MVSKSWETEFSDMTTIAEHHAYDGTIFYVGGVGDKGLVGKIDKNGNILEELDVRAKAEAKGYTVLTQWVYWVYLDGDRLYVLGWNRSIELEKEELFCFDKNTDELLWMRLLEPDDNLYGIANDKHPPEIWGNYLIILTAKTNARNDNHTLIEFIPRDSSTGQPTITRAIADISYQSGTGNIHNDRLYLTTFLNPVMVLDLNKCLDPAVSDVDCVLYADPIENKADYWTGHYNFVFTPDIYIYQTGGYLRAPH
jgi:hypothetical protein